jgi:hypothetical protein
VSRAPRREDFYVALRQGIQRACARKTPREVAAAVDLSKKALGNILTGGETNAKMPFDLLTVEPTALDDVVALYGGRIVLAEPATAFGDLGTALARFQLFIIENPGRDHQTCVKGEAMARELHAATGAWIERCRTIRGSRP